MSEITPIQTIYNGYKFRSRLEARWAVFFDAFGIKYEYEPEGFVGEEGNCYLPDFYLPELELYVEVKPSLEMLLKDEEKLSYVIGTNAIFAEKPLLLLGNIPFYKVNDEIIQQIQIPRFMVFYHNDGKIGTGWCYLLDSKYAHILLHDNGQAINELPKLLDDEKYIKDLYRMVHSVVMYHYGMPWFLDEGTLEVCSADLLKAFTKARQARFEFGEKG